MTQWFDLKTGVTDGQQVGKRGKLPEEWLKTFSAKSVLYILKDRCCYI